MLGLSKLTCNSKWLVTLSLIILTGCGFNILSYVSAGTDSEKAQLEQAKINMDEKNYSDAVKILESMKKDSDKDSNEVRLLLAAANLGVSGLDIWSILGTVLDDSSSGESSIQDLFGNLSSDLLGEGEEKETKLAALDEAVEGLKTAPRPDDTKVRNTACVFSGLMVVPTISDAQNAMTDLDAAITQIQSAGVCSGVANLTSTLGDVSAVALRLSTVYETAQDCPFLGIDTDSLDGINQQLGSISDAADKGCSAADGLAAAFLPQCLKDAAGIPNPSAAANDDRIDSCEIVLHCTDGSSCFQ